MDEKILEREGENENEEVEEEGEEDEGTTWNEETEQRWREEEGTNNEGSEKQMNFQFLRFSSLHSIIHSYSASGDKFNRPR